ncbi:MAG: hypothetical protein HKO65_03050 [Gemmatimonadetes bacterium]|nr:hypothetical protein [Gemmatimonadota bacterium]NNM04056.1 hypothetical protein [Gemmatimonadota bacterium]
MPRNQDERRYSDEEFAVILRTASETPEALPPTLPPDSQDGLTLSEITEIAQEVGIDPEKVSRAAALLPPSETSALTKLIGGGPRYRMECTAQGAVPTEELRRVVEVARTTTGIQGETREVLGGVEWTGSTGTTGYGVSVTPRGDETHLQASANHTEVMAGIYGGVGMGVMGAISLTLAKLVFGESDAGIIASILSGAPAGFLVARTVWTRSAKRYRRRLLHLLDLMRREAEDAVEDAGSENAVEEVTGRLGGDGVKDAPDEAGEER